MIHLGLLILVVAFVSVRYLAMQGRFQLMCAQEGIKTWQGFAIGVFAFMLLAELFYWGGSLIFNYTAI